MLRLSLLLLFFLVSTQPTQADYAHTQTLVPQPPAGSVPQYFGWGMAVSRNTLAVGSYLSHDNGVTNVGSVYIFERNGTQWEQFQHIVPHDGLAGDYFGYSVAMNDNWLAVQAFYDDRVCADCGDVYMYRRDATGWNFHSFLEHDSSDGYHFGFSISFKGEFLAVGARYSASTRGSVSMYRWDSPSSAWTLYQRLVASNAAANSYFGTAVRFMPGLPRRLIVTGHSSSANLAYVFEFNGTAWEEVWNYAGTDETNIGFGYVHSVAGSANNILIGAQLADMNGTDAGALYVFESVSGGSDWELTQKMVPVDVSSGDYFGWVVARSGITLAVSSVHDDISGQTSAGSIYILQKSSAGSWVEIQKLVAPDPAANDRLGANAVFSEDSTLFVGAYLRDIPGSDTGAVYVFQGPCASTESGQNMMWSQSATEFNSQVSLDLQVDASQLTIQVSLTAPLLKDATYVLDVTSYDGEIDQPTKCENREAAIFSERSFSDLWELRNLMYSSTARWTVSYNESDCSTVRFEANFGWTDLVACTDKFGNTNGTSISVQTVNDSVGTLHQLTGNIFVSVVGPYGSSSTRTGLYNIKSLFSSPFQMGVYQSATSVLGTVTVQNFQFQATVVGIVPRSDTIEIIIVTEADQIFTLSAGTVLDNPSAVNGYAMTVSKRNIGAGSSCLATGVSSCLESFVLVVEERDGVCPEYFNGTYQTEFPVECRDNTTDCHSYLPAGTNILFGISVDYWQFECVAVGNVSAIEATPTLIESAGPTNPGDLVQMNVSLNMSPQQLAIVSSVDVENVWICIQPNNITLPPIDVSGTGGCLSPEAINVNLLVLGGVPTTIGSDNQFSSDTTSKTSVAISFSMPPLSNSSEYTVVVVVQVKMNFGPASASQRRLAVKNVASRRSLQQAGGVPPFVYSVATISVEASGGASTQAPRHTVVRAENGNGSDRAVMIVLISAVSVLAVVVTALLCRRKCSQWVCGADAEMDAVEVQPANEMPEQMEMAASLAN